MGDPEPTLHVGTALVAPSSDGATGNVLTAPTSIQVTVRRDFPLRQGERLGEWAWSSADGSVRQDPQQWALDGEDADVPPEDEELHSEQERPIFGWGIGRPSLGAPGDDAGRQLPRECRHTPPAYEHAGKANSGNMRSG